MPEPSCVFCKIVAGQIPCTKVYEDADTLAFLDIGSLAEGHLLIIPKQHYERLDDMPPDLVGKVCATLPRLGKLVMQVTGALGFNLLQNNGAVASQEVPHVHFHIIPRVSGDGLGYRWNRSAAAAQTVRDVHQRLLEAMRG